MLSTEIPETRHINGVTILGPDLFATDEEGNPLSPIASLFPKYRTIVTGRGIHAMQAEIMVEFLKRRLTETGQKEPDDEEEDVYLNAVALLIRDSKVLIRSDPWDMDRIFAADEVLQCLLPKERIQFMGIHLEEVRKKVRRHGESWRISPPPHSVEEVGRYIRSSRVRVGTGATFYHNAPTGGRFITYEEFMRIRPLIRGDKEEALARLKEIVHLTRLINNQGARELSFLLPAEKTLSIGVLEQLISVLEKASDDRETEESETLFDRFATAFAEAAGPELTVDGENYVTWRTTLFCRLYDINEKVVEERSLCLSPEFHLNVRWLPGARISGSNLLFELNVEPRVRSLITHFSQTWNWLVSINVGRVESSQTERDRTGEQREVYLVVLGLADGSEAIRLVRMMKWDTIHRLNQGVPRQQAIEMTMEYRDYIFDRLKAAKELGIPIPSFTEIRLKEEIPGLGVIPVFFFDRQYVPGIVTDKIPPARYAQRGFIVSLSRLLGMAAGASLVLGRACPRTGHVFFDDGDEVIQLDDEGIPNRLIIAETTGSFTNWSTPAVKMLPHCLRHLAGHFKRAEDKGIPRSTLLSAMEAFTEGLTAEITRMQQLLGRPSSRLWSLFADRGNEPGGIRRRWEGILHRLDTTDTEELRKMAWEDPHLAPFRSE